MDRPRRALVAVDLDAEGSVSEGSRVAARQARALAVKTGATLAFLHSRYRESDPLADVGADRLAELVEECAREEVEATARITEGRPWLDVLAAVDAERFDLVIAAKRSGVSSDGRRLGTNAGKLLRKCPSPLWLVHPQQRLPWRTVLAATDLTPVGERAVGYGLLLAEVYDCAAHVVHACSIPMEVQLSHARASESEREAELEAIRESARRGIAAALPRVAARYAPTYHIGFDAPSHAILSAVEHLDPDALVMGTLSRGGIAGLLLGNTAERLLHRVDCTLLTIKPEGWRPPT